MPSRHAHSRPPSLLPALPTPTVHFSLSLSLSLSHPTPLLIPAFFFSSIIPGAVVSHSLFFFSFSLSLSTPIQLPSRVVSSEYRVARGGITFSPLDDSLSSGPAFTDRQAEGQRSDGNSNFRRETNLPAAVERR
jgi:hypothetical protein